MTNKRIPQTHGKQYPRRQSKKAKKLQVNEDVAFETNLMKRYKVAMATAENKLKLNQVLLLIDHQERLEEVIPIALSALEENLLLDASFDRGDLFRSILQVEKEYWIENPDEYMKCLNLLNLLRDAVEWVSQAAADFESPKKSPFHP